MGITLVVGEMNLPAARLVEELKSNRCRVSVLIKPLYSPSPYPLPPGERVMRLEFSHQ
jgi:hypothetical protein